METRAVQSQPLATASVRLIIGAFFTLLGVMLTLDNLNVMESERYLAWWPVILIAIGAVKLVGGGSRWLAAILIVVGTWLTAYNLGFVRFTLFDLWPLLLIAGGAALVARAVGYSPKMDPATLWSSNWGVLGVRKVVETSSDFGGRRYVALLGGCEVDLTGAEIANSPAVVEAVAFWGAVELIVPERWEIIGEVVPIMGGFEVNVRPAGTPEKQLIVRGTAIMAGVEVRNTGGRRS